MPKMFTMLSVVLMLAMLTLVGCSSPQTGVQIGMSGKLSAYLDALPPQVIAAAGEVAKDMELTVESTTSSQLGGRLVAKKYDGTDIKVYVERYGDNISAVRIKVGTWGDKNLSVDYFNAIKAKLAGRARSVAPPSTGDLNLLK